MASVFTQSTVQPQVVAALSQLSSLLHGVRTLHTSVSVPHRRREQVLSKECSTRVGGHEATSISTEKNPVTGETVLSELPNDLDLTLISPVLANIQHHQTTDQWTESHISAQSFFENKNGFPESRLRSEVPLFHEVGQILGSRGFQNFLKTGAVSPFMQQTRGFKTRRSDHVAGLGRDKDTSFIEELRHSVFSRTFLDRKKKQEPAKFQKIMTAHDGHPEFQEKLKVAFAEGYHANTKQEPEKSNTLMSKIVKGVYYMCFACIIYILYTLFKAVGGTPGRGLGVLTRDHFEINPEDININFADVKGVEEAKQELQDIVEFLRDPDKFTALGAKLPKGVLLVGPPGIGKTLLARAVAGEAGVPFFHASGSEFDEIFVGTGAKRVRQMFQAAKMRSPCVIFIDEIDSVGAKRTSSQIHPYANQTINQLLSEMDGFTANEGVIVLGATNRRDNLDKALLRPGRFDVEVRVFPPDLKGRQEIFEYYLGKIKTTDDIDVLKLARGTSGFTGADIENMVNQAALKAAMDGAEAVNMDHMEFSRDKVIMGPAKKNKIPDEDTNWITAYHEAGHTLVAYFTKDATPLHKVTILPRGMSLGHTSMIEEKEVFNRTRSELLAQMDVAMGGRAAEEVVYGMEKVTTGASSDFQIATRIASSMVKVFGMSEKVGTRVFDGDDPFDSGLSMVKVNEVSPGIQEMVDSEIKRILQESYDRAKTILRSHSSEHKALAKALMKHETLDRDDIKAVIEGKPVKQKSS